MKIKSFGDSICRDLASVGEKQVKKISDIRKAESAVIRHAIAWANHETDSRFNIRLANAVARLQKMHNKKT